MTAGRHSARPPEGVDALTVRHARVSDAAEIQQISDDMVLLCNATKFARHLGDMLDSSEAAVFVACSGISIVGWVQVFVARRVGVAAFAEIGGLVTTERFRRRGVGRVLVRECESWAMSKHLPRLRVRCNSRRTGAHEFYAETGFASSKEQVVYDKEL